MKPLGLHPILLCNTRVGQVKKKLTCFRITLTSQIVSVNGVNSDPATVTCGVPQGSILGPLLFLCYINDMPISVNCKLLLYADDSALIVSGKDVQNISYCLSNELESCREWLVNNRLSLHLGKTESILFGSKVMLKKSRPLSVSCDGNLIKSSNSVKYLGIVLDDTLSGNSIARDILKKAGARLKFLYRQSHMLEIMKIIQKFRRNSPKRNHESPLKVIFRIFIGTVLSLSAKLH